MFDKEARLVSVQIVTLFYLVPLLVWQSWWIWGSLKAAGFAGELQLTFVETFILSAIFEQFISTTVIPSTRDEAETRVNGRFFLPPYLFAAVWLASFWV